MENKIHGYRRYVDYLVYLRPFLCYQQQTSPTPCSQHSVIPAVQQAKFHLCTKYWTLQFFMLLGRRLED